MYIVKRKELIKILENKNVIYSELKDYDICGLYRGFDSLKDDFGTVDLINNVEADDFCEVVNILNKAKNNNYHFKMNLEYGQRYGLYNDEQCYVIYEDEDIKELIRVLEEVLGGC